MFRFPLIAIASNMRQSTLPVPYNLSTSQTNGLNVGASDSFWISSFLRGSMATKTSFCLMSLTVRPQLTAHQCWILPIHSSAPNSRPAIPPTPASTLPTTPESVFNFTTSNFSFASTSPSDGLSRMRTWGNYNDVHFDLTFSTSSPRSPKRRHRQLRGHRWYGLGMVHARRQDNWHANSERYNSHRLALALQDMV
jgi:hypothetical protein